MFPIWKVWLPVKKELLLSVSEGNWRQTETLQNIFFKSSNCNHVNVFFLHFPGKFFQLVSVFLLIGCGNLLWCLLFVVFLDLQFNLHCNFQGVAFCQRNYLKISAFSINVQIKQVQQMSHFRNAEIWYRFIIHGTYMENLPYWDCAQISSSNKSLVTLCNARFSAHLLGRQLLFEIENGLFAHVSL